MFSNLSHFQFSFCECLVFRQFIPFFFREHLRPSTPPLLPSSIILTSSFLALGTQVTGSASNVETGLKQHLERLDEIFAARPDYLQTLRFVQLMVNNVIRELTALPDISKANVDMAAIAEQTAVVEYYRWVQLLFNL